MKRLFLLAVFAILIVTAVSAEGVYEVKVTKTVSNKTISLYYSDMDIGDGSNLKGILSKLAENASEEELPAGVVLPPDLSSEEAIQTGLYLIANYVDLDELLLLVQGSIQNGEFDTQVIRPD